MGSEQLKNLDVRALYQFNCYNLKFVKIKSDRVCYRCKSIIPKGKKVLTFNSTGYSGYIRNWACDCCGEELTNSLIELDTNIEYSDIYADPDWDDGYSSNGY